MSDDASVIQRIAIGDGIYVRVPQAAEGAEGALEEPPEARPWRVHYVAVLVGLMLAALALARVGSTADGVLAAALIIVLAVLAGIDIETHLLPNCIVLPSLAAVLSAQIGLHPAQTGEWLGCAAGAALFVALPAALQRRAIGMGDVKLAALLGAALGTSVTTALMLGFLSVFPAGMWVLLRHGRTAARSTALPLGPFLAFGAVVTQLA